jgi:tetratricopeptide (TPR) repeat protein
MLAQGGSYENAGNLNAAEKEYKAIIDENFDYADAWKRLGAVMVKKKNNVEAFRCFQQYLKLRPDDKAVRAWMDKNSRE